MSSEAKVKDAVKKLLKEIGAWYFMPVPYGYGRKTIDFLICYNGRFYGVETKRSGLHEPTALQREEMEAIWKAGGTCCLENTEKCLNVRRILGV